MLSLAMKAGKIKSGEFASENAIKDGTGVLTVVPEDASNNTKKKFRNMCEFYEVPYYEISTKEILGHTIGKEERSSVVVTDMGFAKSIIKKLEALKEFENMPLDSSKSSMLIDNNTEV